MVALELLEERLRGTPLGVGTDRFLHLMLYNSGGSGAETKFRALDITLVQMIQNKMKRGPISAIRPKTYFDALETYTYLRERGGTFYKERKGFPLRYVFHSI